MVVEAYPIPKKNLIFLSATYEDPELEEGDESRAFVKIADKSLATRRVLPKVGCGHRAPGVRSRALPRFARCGPVRLHSVAHGRGAADRVTGDSAHRNSNHNSRFKESGCPKSL
jgi:hypothetical protein